MKYVFQFGIVWDHLPRLVDGAWLTLRLSVGAFVLGLALAALLAFARTSGPRGVRIAVTAYVEFIRNTPFLVQLFVIYFSLPAIGIRFEAVTAALIGMTLNFAGYATEASAPGSSRCRAARSRRGIRSGSRACRSIATSSCIRRCEPSTRRWRASSSC